MNQKETNLLFARVGLVVALSQMIEYNLAEIQAYRKALEPFDEATTIKKKKFGQIVAEVNRQYEKSLHKSLGQNIAQVKQDGIFKDDPSQLTELQGILEERNYVAHQLFKEDVNTKEIEKNAKPTLGRLLNDVERLNKMNNALISQIKELVKEYESLYKTNRVL